MKDILRRVFSTDAAVLFLGVLAAVSFWVFDAVIDTLVFREGDFLRNMFAPELVEAWKRFVVMGLVVGISVYSRRYIARLRRSEEEFRQSEERFDLASRGSSDGLWDWPDVNGDRQWWSPRFFELLGYADGELAPCFSNFKSMLHPEDLDSVEGAFKYHFEARELFNAEYRLRAKSGEYRWFLGRGQSLWDEGGKPTRMSGSIHDITLRKEAEESYHSAVLKACDERARADAVIAGIGDGISLQDTDYKILYQNQVHKDMVGEHTGEYCYNVYEHEDQVCEGCPVEMAFRDGGVHTVERRVEFDEGTRYFEITASPLRDVTGRISSAVEVVRETTERKKAEEELGLRGRVIEDLAEGVFLVRVSDLVMVYSNPRFNGMLGYEDGELTGKLVDVINTETDQDPGATVGEIIEALERDGVWKGEIRNVRKDGTKFWSYTSISTFEHHEYGTVWVVVKMDIDERKRAEEDMHLYIEALDEANDTILVIDPETSRFIYVNDKACTSLGYGREELLQMGVLDIEKAFPEGLDWGDHVSEVREKGHLMFSGVHERKDGTTFPVEVNIKLLKFRGREYSLAVARDITERKRAEEALSKSEKQLRLIADNLPALVSYVDSEERYCFNNRAYEEWFGLSPKDVYGKHIREVLGEGAYKDIKGFIDRALSGEEVTYESTVPYKEGGVRFVNASYIPDREDNGKVKGFYVLVHDITERKRAEEELARHRERLEELVDERTAALKSANEALVREIAERKSAGEELRQSKELYQSLVQTAASVIIVLSTDQRIREFNHEAERIYGVKRADVLGKDYMDSFLPEEARGAVKADMEKVLEGEPTRGFENRIVTPDGREYILLWNITRLLDNDGEPSGVIAIGQDITERRLVEESHRFISDEVGGVTGGKFFERLVLALSKTLNTEFAFVGVVSGDKGEKVQTIAGCRDGSIVDNFEYVLAGAPCENVVGKSICCYPSGVQELFPGFPFLVDKGIESYLGTPLNDSEGRPLGLLCVLGRKPMENCQFAESIFRIFAVRASAEMERMRAEQERERILEELLQSQKMEAVGRLAGGIAHDFNNMMVAVKGLSSLGLKNVDKEDPVHAYFENIQGASDRAIDLTRKLTAFSRRQPTEFAECALNDVVAKLLDMLPPLIGEDIEITTELEPALRPVMADAGNLTQVIMNLVINARDAMQGGGNITIKTENATLDKRHTRNNVEARPGRFVRLTVIDTGSGMDKKTLEHIFEPFYSTKDIGKGTGLGLSVVYGILKSHNGWIEVKSSPGKGTTFLVYLPSVEEEAGRVEEVAAPRDFEPSGAGERILLVEDEELVRLTTKLILEENGYRVVEAANSTDALDIFKREGGGFHLVLTDVVLPDRNGIELADEMAAIKPGVRVILMSGYLADRSQMTKIRQMGFRFIEKPYEVNGLLRSVRESMDEAEVK